jgi:NAD(P)-dependent dehydrogenase (short-subunit alcohol dehydrogenase family)
MTTKMTETNEADVRDNTDPKKSNVAVVTGSSKGMGRAIVLAFAMSNTYTDTACSAANRSELAHLWSTMKQDDQRHLDMLKQELAGDVREGMPR